MDVIGVCADDVVAVDVDGEPVLAVCVFGDSGFHTIWDEDSTFCFGVSIVSMVLVSVHVSRVPVLGFLDQYYSVCCRVRGINVVGLCRNIWPVFCSSSRLQQCMLFVLRSCAEM